MKRSIGAKAILYPTPLLVVGSYDGQGKPNVMMAAWGGVACSDPPCVAVSLRAATYSHAGILAHGAFTVSIPSADQVAEADYFGLATGRKADKFAATGMTAVASDLVDAPYVGEFPFVLECEVRHVNELGLHTQFVGEVMDVRADESCLDEKGGLDFAVFRPAAGLLGDGYYAMGELLGVPFKAGRKFM